MVSGFICLFGVVFFPPAAFKVS